MKCTIKLTVTEDMYHRIAARAESMSVSIPAFCCYVVGERLCAYDLAERESVNLLGRLAGDMFNSAAPAGQEEEPDK